jgi:hypothetical protein
MPTVVMDEHFVNGLSPSSRVPSNSKYLTQCLNMKATKYGGSFFEPITAPRVVDTTFDDDLWPFPQLFQLDSANIVVGQNGLYLWRGPEYSLVPLTTYYPFAGGTDHIAHPTFASGYADHWTLGAGWSVASSKLVRATSTSTTAVQLNASMLTTLVANKLYKVSITITEVTAEGTLQVELCGTPGGIPVASSYYKDVVVGTMEFEIKVGSTLTAGIVLTADAALACKISSITVKEIEVFTFDLDLDILVPFTEAGWTQYPVEIPNTVQFTLSAGVYTATQPNAGTVGAILRLTNANCASELVAGTSYTVTFTIPAGGFPVSPDDVGFDSGIRVQTGSGNVVGTVLAVGEQSFTFVAAHDGDYLEYDGDPDIFYGDFSIMAVLKQGDTVKVSNIKMVATTAAKPFHAISFRKVWMLTNGDITFFCGPSNGFAGGYSWSGWPGWRVVAWNGGTAGAGTIPPSFGCVENFKSRLYVAGLDSTDGFYTYPGSSEKTWETLWNTWLKYRKGEVTFNEDVSEGTTVHGNTVFYGKEDGGDYMWPLSLELAMFGMPDWSAFLDAFPYLLDSLKKRDFGFFHATFDGTILRVQKNGDFLILYGDNGITAVRIGEQEGG